MRLHPPTAALVSLVLSACAGPGASSALVRVKAEPVGINCRAGGSRIETGLDSNANGTLDPTEVTDTQYVCNGAEGPSGPNGPGGLTGADGVPGQPGENAPNVLVQLVPEPAGANCANGGQRVLAGADTDRNGLLEPSEVSVTSYVCDGARGPGITWQSVTGATQAVSNTGYLANSATSRVVITLPVSPAVGDIIQVTGVGDGGFSIAQNAGQIIDARNLGIAPGTHWKTRMTDLTNSGWSSVASSADGMRLVAVGYDAIHTSVDRGETWRANGVSSGLPSILAYWTYAASSADGRRLVVAERSGPVWLSSNGGASWVTPSPSSGLPSAAYWTSVASSADGMTIVLSVGSGKIWTTADGGNTWTAHGGGTSGLPLTATWGAVASSADGTKLLAAGTEVYTSTNSGADWTLRGTITGLPGAPSTFRATCASSSADGNTLVVGEQVGPLWVSSSGGGGWFASDRLAAWGTVASSADGSRLVAVPRYTQAGLAIDHFYSSGDSGSTWGPRGAGGGDYWLGIASSSDGTRLFATTRTALRTSALETTTGITGGINGGQGDALSLQYVGSDRFVVLTARGAGFSLQ